MTVNKKDLNPNFCTCKNIKNHPMNTGTRYKKNKCPFCLKKDVSKYITNYVIMKSFGL